MLFCLNINDDENTRKQEQVAATDGAATQKLPLPKFFFSFFCVF